MSLKLEIARDELIKLTDHAFVKDIYIPDNSLVFGQYPKHTIVTKDEDYMMRRMTEFI